MKLSHEILSTQTAVEAFAEELRGASEIALDTEFHGEKTYTPELMLVQIATLCLPTGCRSNIE